MVQIAAPGEEKVMNTINLTSLKVTVCGAMALAFALAASWSFVKSNEVLRVAGGTPAHMVASAAGHTGAHLAQATAAGLLQ